jgi:hypothetical protein
MSQADPQPQPSPRIERPLGYKAYGSICHLPGSRLGPADHKLEAGMDRILTEKPRDRHDVIIVQEKLDGSNVAVARHKGELLPLGRSGFPAITSPHEQHRHFHHWVLEHRRQFEFLQEGQRISGEWLMQAHGTRYTLKHDPFVVFDLFQGQKRLLFADLVSHASHNGLILARVLSIGPPMSIAAALAALGDFGFHGATDPVEGAVWRVERQGVVDFLGKYVRADKVDGKYLPEISGQPPVWNWQPRAR